MKKLITLLFDILHWFRKLYWRIFKVKTFGARAMILDGDKVFLVKHRYGNLWVFPGGGIKKGENPEDVARREVFEETGMIVNSFFRKLGVYKNINEGKNDTLAIFVTNDWSPDGKLNLFEKFMKVVEIKDSRWFSVNDLPKDTSRATGERIKEHFADSEREYDGEW